MADLSGVKVGDVIYVPGEFESSFTLREVTKITATQVVCGELCGEQRFRIRDGRLIGDNSWHPIYAKLASEDDFLKYRIRVAELKLCKLKLTSNTIDAAEALLRDAS